jgi:hypothetical protein
MSLAASKRPSGGTALRVLRERVSSTSSQERPCPFVDRTGPSTDSNKAADPAAIQSKMATTSRISIWLRGLVATTLPSRSSPINAGKIMGYLALWIDCGLLCVASKGRRVQASCLLSA